MREDKPPVEIMDFADMDYNERDSALSSLDFFDGKFAIERVVHGTQTAEEAIGEINRTLAVFTAEDKKNPQYVRRIAKVEQAGKTLNTMVDDGTVGLKVFNTQQILASVREGYRTHEQAEEYLREMKTSIRTLAAKEEDKSKGEDRLKAHIGDPQEALETLEKFPRTLQDIANLETAEEQLAFMRGFARQAGVEAQLKGERLRNVSGKDDVLFAPEEWKKVIPLLQKQAKREQENGESCPVAFEKLDKLAPDSLVREAQNSPEAPEKDRGGRGD